MVLPARLSTRSVPLTTSVYPLSAADAPGVRTQLSGLVVDTTRMPTAAEQEKATALLRSRTGASFQVERGYTSDYSTVLLALLLATGVVTLGGTFVAVGLAAAEGRADLSTLAAVGAGQ